MYKMTFPKKQKCMYCKKKQLICFTCASCNQCYCMQHKMPELHEEQSRSPHACFFEILSRSQFPENRQYARILGRKSEKH